MSIDSILFDEFIDGLGFSFSPSTVTGYWEGEGGGQETTIYILMFNQK